MWSVAFFGGIRGDGGGKELKDRAARCVLIPIKTNQGVEWANGRTNEQTLEFSPREYSGA